MTNLDNAIRNFLVAELAATDVETLTNIATLKSKKNSLFLAQNKNKFSN